MESTSGKAVVVLEYDHIDHDLFFRVVGKLRDALAGTDVRPKLVHVGINHVAEQVMDALRREDEMALRKHGEGSVIPETEQQKTAAQQGEGMTEQSREELREENEAADGDDMG